MRETYFLFVPIEKEHSAICARSVLFCDRKELLFNNKLTYELVPVESHPVVIDT